MPSAKNQKSYKFTVDLEVWVDDDSKDLSEVWVYQTLIPSINRKIVESNLEFLQEINAFDEYTSGIDIRILVPEEFQEKEEFFYEED